MNRKKPASLHASDQPLLDLCLALKQSGCIIEDRYWENLIQTAIMDIFRQSRKKTVERLLDHLSDSDSETHDILLEHAETLSESCEWVHEDVAYDCVFVAIPVIAWTRFEIPLPILDDATQQALTAKLAQHIAASDVRMAIHPQILSVDQMPRSFTGVFQWMSAITARVFGTAVRSGVPVDDLSEDMQLMSDSRFVLAAFCTPKGKAIFRWQQAQGQFSEQRDICLENWREAATPLFQKLLPACGIELMLPDAFYIANRQADKRIRFAAITAAMQWLQTVFDTTPDAFRATVALYQDDNLREIRIGFTLLQSHEVIYGCLWPVFPDETDEQQLETINDVAQLNTLLEHLQGNGVRHITCLKETLDGSNDVSDEPLFPNPAGELMPVMMPDVSEDPIGRFH